MSKTFRQRGYKTTHPLGYCDQNKADRGDKLHTAMHRTNRSGQMWMLGTRIEKKYCEKHKDKDRCHHGEKQRHWRMVRRILKGLKERNIRKSVY